MAATGPGTIHAKIEVMPPVSKLLGRGEGTVDAVVSAGTTVQGLLTWLCARHPALGDVLFEAGVLSGELTLLLNGVLLDVPQGLERELANGDTICLLPAFAGGTAL